MKKILFLVMAIAITSLNVVLAEAPTIIEEPYKALNLTPEREKQIIDVANGVIERNAPDFKNDGLTPSIFKFPVPQNHPILNENSIVVFFMKDKNDYREVGMFSLDEGKMAKKTRRTPKFTIMVVMNGETFEPYFIMDNNNRSQAFSPTYIEFCKKNPAYRFKKL